MPGSVTYHPAVVTAGLSGVATAFKVPPVAAVRNLLSQPDEELDFASAAATIDRIIDPDSDAVATIGQVNRLAEAARHIAGPDRGEDRTLSAIRTVLHRPGPWNGGRPFCYDHDSYRSLGLKLISNYLRSRRGNCVSMPILFLILADRLDIDIGLALAPSHLLVRFRNAAGREINLEATSGALPARDAWIRQERRISDRSIATGLYLRKLNRRESVAAMALTVIEHLMAGRRYEEAIQATELIVQHSPLNAFALAHQGQACFHLVNGYLEKYRSAFLIPPALRPRYDQLLRRNREAFEAAGALGWEAVGAGTAPNQSKRSRGL